jgi:hypothetical protein
MVLENFLTHCENVINITNAAHYLRGKTNHEQLPAV